MEVLQTSPGKDVTGTEGLRFRGAGGRSENAGADGLGGLGFEPSAMYGKEWERGAAEGPPSGPVLRGLQWSGRALVAVLRGITGDRQYLPMPLFLIFWLVLMLWVVTHGLKKGVVEMPSQPHIAR